jgi:hypothetical protein
MKLDVKAFGLALGILWAAGYAVLAVLTMTNGYGADIVTWMSKYYIGSGANPIGIVVGAVWAFVDAGIGGVVLAWLYNKFAK